MASVANVRLHVVAVLLQIGDNDVPDHAEVLVTLLSQMLSTFIPIFLAAQTLLSVAEIVMQRIMSIALGHVAAQWFTLSPLHFTFQTKLLGTTYRMSFVMVAPINLRQGEDCRMKGSVSLDGRMRLSPQSAVSSGARLVAVPLNLSRSENCSSTTVLERMVVTQLRCHAMARDHSKVI